MDQSFNANNDFNISDIIEVIETNDPGFVEGAASQQQQSLNMLSGGRVDAVRSVPVSNSGNTPYAEIVEQPAGKALRFRYECEGRSAGSIPGVNSMPENKTFPTIRIVGYKGRAVVVVSCVTMDPPYRPHPHNLVGKEGCKKGVCTIEVPVETMTVSFANLGIQCVKKRDIEEALNVREKIQVDPFRTGYEHKRQPTSIDLNAVRLCFQVFLEGPTPGKFKTPLKPIVSDPIYDKKAKSDLIISKLSHCSASVAGGTEVILLCEKIAKEDIQVRFFEEKDDKVVWEGLADFQPANVHKQFAIAFRTPTYRIQQVDQPVQVYIQLRRPSDGTASEPLPFQMLPLGAGRPNFWSLRRALTRKKADPTTFSKILATEASLYPSQKISRSIDEFNNNELDLTCSSGKLSALRALNDLYHVKNNLGVQNGGSLRLSQSQEIAPKRPLVDDENNEITIISESKFQNSLNKPASIKDDISPKKIHYEPEKMSTNDISEPPKDKNWLNYSEVGKWVQKNQQFENVPKPDDSNSKNDESDPKLNELLTQVAELDQIYADTHAKMLQATLNRDSRDQQMEVDVCDNQTYTSLQMAMKNPVDIYDIKNDRKYEDVAVPSVEANVPPPRPPPLAAKRDVTRAYEEKLPPLPPKRIRKMPSMPVLPRTASCGAVSVTGSEAPHKKLPLLPGTLRPKQGLFSKLFTKRNKKEKDNQSFRHSIGAFKDSLEEFQNQNQLTRPSMTSITGVKSLDIDGDESPPYGIELTEAEHYALYTAMAPHATASEFDEMSFYYSPVEGGKILTEAKET
ncbi:embryonic polarity protein dorsal isoform X1 [Diachasma alloeum]|uniref:embryonic polarity protein dorsal isoform X1 n=1 Tax=Diachasma alloeum TaxID=454923 RepID=UPI0007383DF7|nr:embryonic polarity protein dorsal isoform X1 [Diachasma alloeum]